MKTIFICIDWFLPAYKAGGPVQSIANLVTQYPGGEVNFKIFCSNTDLDGTINEGIVFNKWVDYNAHTQVWYASKDNCSVNVMQQEVRLSKAEVLFIIGIYSWYFNLVPLLFGRAPVKIISVRGMLHPGALSQKSFKKKVYLAIWKMTGLHRRCFFHATDEQEQGFIRQVFGEQARVFIAGNYPRIFTFQQSLDKQPGALRMISVALVSPMKNILLVLDALQDCKERVQYDIYGPVKEEGYWQQCKEKIQQLPANITVGYHGDIAPSKIEDTLKGYEVFILPSKSENFGHAIYEALSAGKPVITSHHTPYNDLQSQFAGVNVSTENITGLSEAIRFFAAMPASEFSKWNTGAREYAMKQVDLGRVKEQYDAMFMVGFAQKKS